MLNSTSAWNSMCTIHAICVPLNVQLFLCTHSVSGVPVHTWLHIYAEKNKYVYEIIFAVP